MSSHFLRVFSVVIPLVLCGSSSFSKNAKLSFEHPRYELPEYLADLLSKEDRELYTRLLNINIESA